MEAQQREETEKTLGVDAGAGAGAGMNLGAGGKKAGRSSTAVRVLKARYGHHNDTLAVSGDWCVSCYTQIGPI